MIIETRLCTNRIWKCSYFAIPSQCLNLNNLDSKTAFLKSSYYGSKLVSFQFCTMPIINTPGLQWNFFILSPFSCFLDYFPSFLIFLSSFPSIVLSLEQCFIFLSLYLLPLKLFIFGFSDFFAAEAQNQFSEITFSTF